MSLYRVKGVTDAVQIQCGMGHDCALRRDGRIACWGGNSSGELGNGGTEGSLDAVAVKGIAGAVEISVGASHTCSVDKSGAVWCWGEGTYGQLGDGRLEGSKIPAMVQGLTDATHLAAGSMFTCAERRTGATVCWGSRAASGHGRVAAPRELPGLATARTVTVGDGWVCATPAKGPTRCFVPGKSGAGPVEAAATLDDVAVMRGSVAYSSSSCVVRKSGKVDCWNEFAPEVKPYTLTGLGPTRSVAIGNSNQTTGFAVLRSGTIAALALPKREVERKGNVPVGSETVKGLGPAVDITGNGSSACALLKSGEVHCLRVEEDEGVRKPLVQVHMPFTDATAIVHGRGRFVVLHKTGAVSHWPADENEFQKWPTLVVRVEGVSDAVEVASGDAFGCARLRSGEVACWGKNGCGQLGTNDFVTRMTAAKVSGLSEVISLDANATQVCAARKDGRVVCWGCTLGEPETYLQPVDVVDEATK